MRKIIVLFFLAIFYTSCLAQFKKNYIPLPITDTIPSQLQQLIKARVESDKLKTKAVMANKEQCKYKCGLYEEVSKEIINTFNNDYFMIDTVFTQYLQKISDKIYAGNPRLIKETRIYAYRSSIPNAVCFGEGTIAFNLGLLKRLENESQIAFIICHELAHYHLRHSELRLDKLTALNFDKTLEKEINQIKKDEYNKYSRLKELMKDLTFDVTKHSRVNENEADSVGLSYLINTSYDAFAAVRAMEILDSCDSPLYKKNLDLKKFFHFEKYPFNNLWDQYDTLEFIYAKEEYSDSDTASTHPDCKKRIGNLKRQLKNYSYNNANKSKEGILHYQSFLISCDFEMIESLYHYRKLGDALYHTLILLEKYPENIYLNAMVGKCLYGIYYYQSIKEFGKVVPLPDNRYSESYNRFLSFIHNLRLIEISKISTNYIELRSPGFSGDEEFLYSSILNSKLPSSTLDKTALINSYKEKFPNGKYLNKLKTL